MTVSQLTSGGEDRGVLHGALLYLFSGLQTKLLSSLSMASTLSSLLLPSGPSFPKRLQCKNQHKSTIKTSNFGVCSCSLSHENSVSTITDREDYCIITRRSMVGLLCGIPAFSLLPFNANGAGLPPEDKPKLCDQACEKELENIPMVTTESGLQYKDIVVGEGPSPPIGFQVAANYVAMVPSGQIFDSSLEKGQPYIFRVGSGQVIKGLDEGILSMKVGGKRRLYIPGSLAFPKGLNSAPGRPRVAPNSPVMFDVSLLYIPGLDDE
ncbi:Peptidylprolyl isomerase [Rhynchospora pubera]|uniref:peptidylprolyl isomerase n=2 Tax=Rhynchospora pubera TaxID=906938 RepID=A0AAV8GW19_9POAL|nr:Peptidylprolyl isomerase [Rhynchospora pubera]